MGHWPSLQNSFQKMSYLNIIDIYKHKCLGIVWMFKEVQTFDIYSIVKDLKKKIKRHVCTGGTENY